MAQIRPFAAIRYDEAVVGELSRVTSPPYDVISPQDRVYYHKLHPNNFVRLVLGEEFATDNESDNRFSRAKRYLDEWLASGVLKQDPQPAIYVYQQVFQHNGQRSSVRGLTCAVKLQDYAEKVILPHEQTLAQPKSDLAELIRQVKANLDCVYGLYADPDGALNVVMDNATSGKPIEHAVDKSGVANRLWAVTDAAQIEKVRAFMGDKQVAIADGHHRYEAALAYRDEMRKTETLVGPRHDVPAQPARGDREFDYVLMTLINVYEPHMIVYPTHRVLDGLSEDALARLDENLKECFKAKASSKKTMIDEMARAGAIGMYRRSAATILTPKPGIGSRMPGSEPSRKLELNVLHKLILEPYLGINDENLRNQAHIFYTRDASEAFGLVDSGERQIAFFVNHIPVKAVLDVATAGEKMPQKATYFYPKLLSGLALRKLD